jgi:hypothetical protein
LIDFSLKIPPFLPIILANIGYRSHGYQPREDSVEILFLYERLHHVAQKQLAALKRMDFGELEELTSERETVTRELCDKIRSMDLGENDLPIGIKNKIHEVTSEVLRIDQEIKDLLLEELSERTLELSGFKKLLD